MANKLESLTIMYCHDIGRIRIGDESREEILKMMRKIRYVSRHKNRCKRAILYVFFLLAVKINLDEEPLFTESQHLLWNNRSPGIGTKISLEQGRVSVHMFKYCCIHQFYLTLRFF